MPIQAASPSDSGFTTSAPEKSNVRWAVCGLLFLATTINYMDRSVFSLIEPLLHLDFMAGLPGLDHAHQHAYDINYGRVLIAFQIAYGVGFLFAGRIIDKLGTKRATPSPSSFGDAPPSAPLWSRVSSAS